MKQITQQLKICGIYCIINLVNLKCYIGSSKNIYQRLLKHRSLLRKNKHDNSYLQNAWNKYGENNFDYFILDKVIEDQLTTREQVFIDISRSNYNLTRLVQRNILSPESRLKQSRTRKKLFKEGILVSSSCKKVYQYNLNGEYLGSFPSITKASNVNNISSSSIERYLNGTYKKGGGYLWSYEYKERLPKYEKYIHKVNYKFYKPVYLLDYNTKEIIQEFKSVKDCASYFHKFSSSISESIKKKRKFMKKYMIIFKSAPISSDINGAEDELLEG